MTTFSKLRRLAVVILATATATAGLAGLAAAPSGAVAGFTWDRLDGQDRFDTARRIAVETYGTADTVLLARADLFPDALAGSYLAGSTVDGGSPILLTEVNRIPQATNEAFATLGTERIILLGGPNAISSAVESDLRSRNFQVQRIGGRDRFETAQQVAEFPGASNVGTVDSDRTAIVASGRNFPDALAGGPLAYASRLPSLITETNSLPQPTRNALTNLSIKRVFLLGGTTAVTGNVEAQLRDMGITVERFGGTNRQHTAVLIAEMAIDRLGFDDTHVNLARGDNFADALTGGPHSGDERDGGSSPGAAAAPIILSLSPTVLGNETSDFLTDHSSTLHDGHIFGGTAAISDAVAEEAANAAGAGRSAVDLDATEVEAGEAITGNISGDPDEVVVSGCGLNDRDLTLASNGDFSLVIPESQPAGECTLTFQMTFADGSEETESVRITITAPITTATAAPELVSVSFVRSFTQPNAGGTPYDQTVIRYTFDENVTGQALISADTATNGCDDDDRGCSTKFKLYRFDQTVSSNNPNRVYSGRSAQIDPDDAKSVLVTFGQAPSTGPPSVNRELGTTELRDVTLAGVKEDAVRDSSNIANPFGDSGLNALSFVPGGTVAPDLVNITNFRPNFDTTRTLVDFVFDEPAVPSTAAQAPNGGGYVLILNDADVTRLECNFQAGQPGSTTSGSGTTTHTVSCPTVALSQIVPASVARGLVEAGTVGAPASGSTLQPDAARMNPLQAHDVTGEGATSRPDLVSAQFFDGNVDGTLAGWDQVLYTFDEAVLVPSDTPQCTTSCFAVYGADGDETFGGSVAGKPTVRASGNDNQVIVTFPDGAINDATGASVREGAVLEAVGTGGVNRINREDEVAVQGVTFAAGFTSAPDFVACELETTQRDPISGNPTAFQLVFVFDEEIAEDDPDTALVNEGPGPDPAKFAVYDATGARITPKTSGGVAQGANPQRRADQHEVLLAGYAHQGDLQNVASCGVDDGAVVAEDDKAPNPIGYEVIS